MDLSSLLWSCCVFLLLCGSVLSDIRVILFNETYGPYDDKVGEFGYSYMGTFRAPLYIAQPPNGCGTIRPFHTENSFVLIDDGACSYYEKVSNARNAGFSIAIVRSLDSNHLITMKGPRIDMLSVYVGKDTGEVLAKYNFTTKATVIVNVEFYINFEIYLIPLVIIIGICFLLMILFLVIKYWRTRIQERRSRLTPANLKKIPTSKYKEGDDFDLCAICLEEYKVGEKLRLLPCNHVYHCKCVDPWLTNGKKTCPVCKQPVEKDDSKKGKTNTQPTERTPLLHNDLPTTSHQSLTDNSVAEAV